MEKTAHRQDRLLLGFISFSLLLHILLLLLLPQRNLFPPPERHEPVTVELRPPQTAEARPRELDVPTPEKPEVDRQTPARRLGPADQTVKREMAPQGDAPDEIRPDAPVPPAAAPRPRAQTAPRPEKKAPTVTPSRPSRPKPESALERPAATGPPPRPETAVPTPVPAAPEVPDIQSLLELPQTTVARLESEWRRKYRADVDRGEAIWLDMESDLLISFLQRFRNQIYGVWQYPRTAAERGEEGKCLIKVTIDRQGKLVKAELLESTSFKALDENALTALKKASPFGPLPRAYEREVLIMFLTFQYEIVTRQIYLR